MREASPLDRYYFHSCRRTFYIGYRPKLSKFLMDTAVAGDIDGIAADCGGLMTCATCHAFVQEPFAPQVGPPAAEEKNMLAFTAMPARTNSRLIPFLNHSCTLSASLAVRLYCLRFAFAFTNDLETE
jgi:ferredoxin